MYAGESAFVLVEASLLKAETYNVFSNPDVGNTGL